MFSRIRNFFYRHRRKFIVTGVVIGGTMLVSRYAQKKFIEWQEKQAKDFLERTRKQHHFERTERTCNQTIISLSSPLKEVIIQVADIDECLKQLRNGTDNKVALWEELKVLAFTKHSALLYSGLMLVVILRVQLNLIGGYICKEAIEMNYNSTLDVNFQEKYLGLCQHFIKEGIEKLCALIKRHVKLVVKDIPLNKKMSLKDIEHIFWSIQASVIGDKNDPIQNLANYLLPSKDVINQSFGNTELSKKLTAETFEILESEETVSLCYSVLSRGYSNTLDRIAEHFIPKQESVNPPPEKVQERAGTSRTGSNSSFTDLNKAKIPLANLIPKMHKLLDLGLKEEPEAWIHQFIVMDSIKSFGANLYEAYSYSG